MSAKLLDRKPERLPDLLVGSKIPWLGIHQTGGTVSGNLIVLSPEAWIGKTFALADYIPQGNTLKTGRWIVLLYHNGSSTCAQALPAYKQLMIGNRDRRLRIALVEILPHEEGNLGGWDDLNASLPDQWDWFATTPVVVGIEDGRVVLAVTGESAIDAQGFAHTCGFDK